MRQENSKDGTTMDLIVKNSHSALWGDTEFPCAIGRGGVIAPNAKKEGDGATPAGRWLMREVFYRADRVKKPETILPVRALCPQDGWCDAPNDPNYNKFVQHPYPASAEHLWRDDALYDVIVVLGYNDDPVVLGKGSAIFLHLARPDLGPSTGCVHLRLEDMLRVLGEATAASTVVIPTP